MFWVNIILDVTNGETITTRYPQSFPTREAAEHFQKTNSAKFKETVVFEEVAPQPAPIGFNEEDLPLEGPGEEGPGEESEAKSDQG